MAMKQTFEDKVFDAFPMSRQLRFFDEQEGDFFMRTLLRSVSRSWIVGSASLELSAEAVLSGA